MHTCENSRFWQKNKIQKFKIQKKLQLIYCLKYYSTYCVRRKCQCESTSDEKKTTRKRAQVPQKKGTLIRGGNVLYSFIAINLNNT